MIRSGGRIRPRSIRSERESGRLVGTRVAGKWLYRKSDVLAFLEVARCPVPISAQSSSLSAKRDGTGLLFYISWTEWRQDQAARKRVSMPPILTRIPPRKHTSWKLAPGKGTCTPQRPPAEPPGRWVWLADVIEDYAREHGGDVVAWETLAISARPLLHFFRPDTIATMTPNRVRAYWDWRRRHSLRVVDKDAGTVEVVERLIADGTIIRELSGTLRPAIQHAIKERRLVPGVYHVPVPTAPPGRDYWITRSEAARLLWETRRDKRARLHLPLYAMIALYTGQRRGAILDLTWPQIDLVQGRIGTSTLPGRPP